mmetsp:Transcript_30452/g.37361  ORF Transcript_30452/g.37361 Transcript_30452/m.37361 type:complete len:378 (-) Transcript_30452:55-1188(-)
MKVKEVNRIRRRRLQERSERHFMKTVKSFDLFPKFKDKDINEIRISSIKTNFGGFYSVIGLIIIFWICFQEIYGFIFPKREEHLIIDKSFQKKLNIKFDIEFHSIPCNSLGIDVMDVTGEQQVHVNQDIKTIRLDMNGKPLRHQNKPYHHPKHTNPMQQIQAQLFEGLRLDTETHEGCRVMGDLHVQRVSGNFHLALGASHEVHGKHVHQFVLSDIPKFNCSHTINHLSFGPYFRKQLTPLNKQKHLIVNEGSGVFTYNIHIIPVEYMSPLGYKTNSNQFKYDFKYKHILKPKPGQLMMAALPGVFFIYKFSPFMLQINEKRQSLFGLLIDLCALCGGVYAISTMLDSYTFKVFYINKAKQVLQQTKQMLYNQKSPI